jgi:hypothetical protein
MEPEGSLPHSQEPATCAYRIRFYDEYKFISVLSNIMMHIAMAPEICFPSHHTLS